MKCKKIKHFLSFSVDISVVNTRLLQKISICVSVKFHMSSFFNLNILFIEITSFFHIYCALFQILVQQIYQNNVIIILKFTERR